jgi:hypothetical protein
MGVDLTDDRVTAIALVGFGLRLIDPEGIFVAATVSHLRPH